MFLMVSIAFDTVGICQIISGYILLASIYNIKRFYQSRNDYEMVDAGMMQRHALCFGIQLLATIAFFASFNLSLLDKSWIKTQVLFDWTSTFYFLASLLSQILLVYILYDIIKGSSTPPNQSTTKSINTGIQSYTDSDLSQNIVEVEEGNFDEDDEM